MKRLRFTLLSLALLVALSACASAPKYKFTEHGHYQRIKPVVPVQGEKGHIELVEVFFYACPHCYQLEPKLKKWLEKKSKNITLRRMPAVVGPTWVNLAMAYYTAEKLGVLDKIHQPLYESIHHGGKQYYTEQSLLPFFTSHGVDAEAFIQAYRSKEVADKVSQARVMTVKYQLRGVPAVIINGKYKTAPYMAGSQEVMLEVIDQLIEMESKETLKN